MCMLFVNLETHENHTATSKSLEKEELVKVGFEYVTEQDRVEIN